VSPWLLLGIALLGGAGAVARVAVDALVSARAGTGFPWGILAVNLSGAALLGLLAGLAVHGDARRLLGTALLGSYTTFSTWMLDSHRLAEERRTALALANLLGSIVLGLLAVWAGRELGELL
jgi:fluoride exporter